MATKEYLDAEGIKRLKEYIDDQFSVLKKAIDLLNDKNGTPGSIQQMIDNAVNELHIENLEQEEPIGIYGGSATDVIGGAD